MMAGCLNAVATVLCDGNQLKWRASGQNAKQVSFHGGKRPQCNTHNNKSAASTSKHLMQSRLVYTELMSPS